MPTSCRSSEVAARRRWPQRLALALLLLVVAPLGGGAWRYKQNNDDMMKEPHTAVDLTGDNFNTLLVALPPGTPCIVKFYASWASAGARERAMAHAGAGASELHA